MLACFYINYLSGKKKTRYLYLPGKKKEAKVSAVVSWRCVCWCFWDTPECICSCIYSIHSLNHFVLFCVICFLYFEWIYGCCCSCCSSCCVRMVCVCVCVCVCVFCSFFGMLLLYDATEYFWSCIYLIHLLTRFVLFCVILFFPMILWLLLSIFVYG